MALITCKDGAFAYEGQTVIENLNFEVNSGDCLVILGENGSGKSTLVKGMLRLKTPSHGTITLGDGLRPKQIGYLPQQTPAQRDFPASVREVVLSGRLNARGLHPFYTAADKMEAAENMERLGITGLSKKSYRDLSGGQQQRVLLARAMCAASTLLLLDEPAAGLDPVVTAELYDIIRTLNREMGLTIVMVSHDLHGALTESTHVLHLDKTQLFFGKTADYLASPVGKRFTGGEANA